MPEPDLLRRIAAFRASFARRQAATVTEVPGGAVVLNPAYAASHVDNQLVIDAGIDGELDPACLPEIAETVLAGLPQRRIAVLDDALGRACAPALTAVGYTHERELVMTYAGPPVPEPARQAEVVGLEELRPALVRQIRIWMPEASATVVRQMADRRAARLRGADRVRFLAVRDEEGTIGATADLYLHGPAGAEGRGIAQIEEVITNDTHVRRGYGDALLATALHQAVDYSLFFLLASEGDWPADWYARRGFSLAGRSHVFSRAPG